MRNLNRGQNLYQKELKEIADNFYFTIHGSGRIIERKGLSHEDLKAKILNPFLAYFNTDGSINVAPSEFECYIFCKCEDGRYCMVTYKERTYTSMVKKQQLAMRGIHRW